MYVRGKAKFNMYKDRKIVLIIAAAGRGTRLGHSLPKQFIKMDGLGDRSPLQKSILTAGIVKEIDEVIVVTNPEYIDLTYEQIAEEADAHSSSVAKFEVKEASQSLGKDGLQSKDQIFGRGQDRKRLYVIEGGSSRQESTSRGIKFALQDKPENYIVLIHDAARPNASPELFHRVIEAAFEKGAVVPAIRLKDTIRDVNKGTLNRDDLRAVQTPQGFAGEIILNAIKYAEENCFVGTDEGSLVDFAG